MPTLTVHQIRLNLPPGVFAALEEELRIGGLASGIFCIGPAIIPLEALLLMWIFSGDVRVTSTVPRSSLADADGARKVARAFAEKCKARGE
jgi:hypothetical protein